MRLQVFDSATATAKAAADRVAATLQADPGLVIGLASGRTPIPVYAELRRLHAENGVSFSRAVTFSLDEFAGIDADHPGSFHSFLQQHLLAAVDLDPTRVHFLNGQAADLDAECDRYERIIADAGGIDLLVLGIGVNGHIGFNEPGETLAARTHRVVLHDATRDDNAARFGGNPAAVPREALSMGMGTILKASAIVLIATGAHKAACIEQAVRGPLTTRLPASFLQTHRHVDVYLDRDAASRLSSPNPERG